MYGIFGSDCHANEVDKGVVWGKSGGFNVKKSAVFGKIAVYIGVIWYGYGFMYLFHGGILSGFVL